MFTLELELPACLEMLMAACDDGELIRDLVTGEAGPEEDACTYKVIVYAYPENAVSRFFARHLGIAERYFHQKTKDITALSIAISKHLLSLNPARIESHMLVGQERHRQRPERSRIMPGVVIGCLDIRGATVCGRKGIPGIPCAFD